MSREQLPTENETAATDPTVDEATAVDLTVDPKDYSAIGGPENEPAYGRTRAIAGEYPFNEQGGPYDRDEPSHVERGGILTHHHVTKQT